LEIQNLPLEVLNLTLEVPKYTLEALKLTLEVPDLPFFPKKPTLKRQARHSRATFGAECAGFRKFLQTSQG
jgi:hypothetical protein